MSTERQARILFLINAVTNWVISARGIIDPIGMAHAFGGAAPNYPFVIRLWMAFVYNWIEKTLNATAITIGTFRARRRFGCSC
jgi:hypothetical protein